MKDHEIAALVNELRDVAVTYGQTQQLRERIAHIIVPVLKELSADGERLDWIQRQADEFNSGMIEDAGNAGHFFVMGMTGYHHGETFRAALDKAREV